MAFGVLLFKRSWRISFFQLPDKLYDKEERPLFKMDCRSWETLIMAIFAKFGWNFRNRIEA
uniref:Uncharacterized protein n=1 Tax=Oryza meridionalis TaxID=40149 RepID=A0A0E0D562_9ORYZ